MGEGTAGPGQEPAPHTLAPASRPEDLFAAAMVDVAPDGMAVVDEGGRLRLVNRQVEELFGYRADELVGRPVELLVPEPLRAAHEGHRTEFWDEPRTRSMGGAGLVLYGRRRDGSEFPVEISLSPMQVGRHMFLVAAVRDVTERLALEAESRTVREVLDATRDAMLIFERGTLRLVYVNEGAVRQLGYSRRELLGMTQLQVKPALGEDEYRRMIDRLEPGDSVTFSTLHRRKDGSDVEVEVTLQRPKVAPGDEGSHLLISVARDVSRRLEAERRLHAAEREIAVLDERQRIARDLHDRVIQRLFAAGLAASSIASGVGDPLARSRVEQVVRDLDETISDLRSSIFHLTTTSADASLRKQVLDLCEAECDVVHLTSNVRFSGPVDTVDAVRAGELLAVLREALSNVGRHAHASTVDVTVTVDASSVRLEVEDDGVGLSRTELGHAGHGLVNMAARARELGGSFAVEPGGAAGIRLAWRVPA